MVADRHTNTSLAKALTVLDAFDATQRELTLTELARSLGSLPGSLYPIVCTLERFGYLIRDEASKRYRLGLRILAHANHVLAALDIREQAKPVLRGLAAELVCNAHLAVPYEDEVLYLDREEAAPSVVVPSAIGWRAPLHCTALGKIFLAFCDRVQQQFFLTKRELSCVTPNTISNLDVLRHEIKGVRASGYAFDQEEFHLGNTCIAAPVRDYRNTVVAAISISLATSRLEREPREHFVERIVKGAWVVSSAIGCTDPPPLVR